MKSFSGVDTLESARLLIEHHPNDARAVRIGISDLWEDYPEEAVAAIVPILPEDGILPSFALQMRFGNAYERLDMLYEAADQYQRAYAIAGLFDKNKDYGIVHPKVRALWAYNKLEKGERNYPSIWEERAASAPGVESPKPQDTTPSHLPPANLEAEMSAAYADFAKAYQSAFEMEYALSAATPEGYMNALLGMARAFARAGDAQNAQDAYNAARKRYSPEEIQQAFRRFDEQDRLRRQASNEQDDGEGD